MYLWGINSKETAIEQSFLTINVLNEPSSHSSPPSSFISFIGRSCSDKALTHDINCASQPGDGAQKYFYDRLLMSNVYVEEGGGDNNL